MSEIDHFNVLADILREVIHNQRRIEEKLDRLLAQGPRVSETYMGLASPFPTQK